jgi:hypothetical protein
MTEAERLYLKDLLTGKVKGPSLRDVPHETPKTFIILPMKSSTKYERS